MEETATAMRNSSKPYVLHFFAGLLAALALLAACTRPTDNHLLVSQWTADNQGGEYGFSASFDTSARFALRLAARMVASRIPEECLAFDIRITTPDGATAIERVDLPLHSSGDDGIRIIPGSGSVTDFEWPWRSLDATPGTWTFHVRPANPERADALYGLGFSYSLNDGKR